MMEGGGGRVACRFVSMRVCARVVEREGEEAGRKRRRGEAPPPINQLPPWEGKGGFNSDCMGAAGTSDGRVAGADTGR